MSLPMALVWITTGVVLTLIVLAALATAWGPQRHPEGTPGPPGPPGPMGPMGAAPVLPVTREEVEAMHRDLADLARDLQEVATVVRALTPEAPSPGTPAGTREGTPAASAVPGTPEYPYGSPSPYSAPLDPATGLPTTPGYP